MKQAVVIGGGLAGCAAAEAFSRRGWQVRVLEARPHLGGAVAGVPLLAQHPALTPDFDLRSRLLVQAMQLHGRLRATEASDVSTAFEVCGRLQPMEPVRAARCVRHVEASVARVAGAASAAGSAGAVADGPHIGDMAGATRPDPAVGAEAGAVPAGHEGIWFPGCAAVSPARWWQQVLARPQVTVQLGVKVGRIVRGVPGPWQAGNAGGGTGGVMGCGTGAPQTDGVKAAASVSPDMGGSVAGAPAAPDEKWHVFSAVAATGAASAGARPTGVMSAGDGVSEGQEGPDDPVAPETGETLLATADVVVLACQLDSFALAGMQEADHGRLRLSAAQVWMARADGGPAQEDPGHPALLPILGGRGLVLTRPGAFWVRSEEAHRHWLQTGEEPEGTWAQAMGSRAGTYGATGTSGASGVSGVSGATGMAGTTGTTGTSGMAGTAGMTGTTARADDADTMQAACRDYLSRPESWQPSAIGERLQLRDNLPMIGLAPDTDAIAAQADALARNDRLPMPRQAGLYLLTGLAGRGMLYAAIGAEMLAALACGEAPVVDTALERAVDPARFIKRRLQRAWSQKAAG